MKRPRLFGAFLIGAHLSTNIPYSLHGQFRSDMKRISSGSIGIQQGSRVLFSDFADGGPMWTGQGDRESRHVITFKEAFTEAPAVTVSISMWDIDNKHTSRADVSAEKITAKGFHLVFRTWGDTRVARVRADWMALGSLRGDDDWDVQ
jgi:hypothetical protein